MSTGESGIGELLAIMARLRDPERGCPWDVQQDFSSIAPSLPSINAGRLRAIGMASAQRVKKFETTPTRDEQDLKGFEAYAGQGLLGHRQK